MELELRQETARGWETVCRATLEQEETAEMIVPDACPDIWQVLDGEARLLLQRKEAQDGKGEFSGLLKTTILYQPEGEQGIGSMEVTLPFSLSPELTNLTRRSCLHVVPRVLSVDVHLLNPRKVLVRVGYCLEVEGFEPQARSLASLVEDPEPQGIRQRTGELRTFQTVYAQEKSFTYQDTLVLPAGRPDAAELLRTRAQCVCTEARVIGNKLVFKGEATLQLLCRGDDGNLFTGDFHLPYSQIMDAGEESEEGLCHMDLLFTDVKCTPAEEDRRSFQVELAVQAQAVLRREVTLPVLTDLYSTSYEAEVQREACPVCRLLEQGEEREDLRQTVEAPSLGPLLDVQVRLGRASQSQDGEDRVLTQEVELMLLYESEEGPAAAHQQAQVAHRLPGQGDGKCTFYVELLREPTASPMGEGMEVSCPVCFHWMTLEEEETQVISRVTLGEKRTEAAQGPSVIIRAVRPGEDLWAVAKAYCTTDGEIMEASGLTDQEIYPGQMLLIPRKSC